MIGAGRIRAARLTGGFFMLLALLAPAVARSATLQVPVQTVPPVAGATISVAGADYTTDSKGRALVSIPAPPSGSSTQRTTSGVEVTPPPAGADRRVRFQSWSGGVLGLTASFETYTRVRLRFIDPEGARIDPATIDSISLVSSSERRRTVSGGGPFWLRSGRVALHPGGANESVLWSIETVMVDGSNVVNRAQQTFRPEKNARLTVPVLFYSVTLSAEDAIFGFPIGSAVEVQAPDGSTSKLALGPNATATLPSVPRGEYELKVDALGISFTRPLTVSRNQTLTLNVISVPDIVVVIAVLLAVALTLLLARRPALRARIRRTSGPAAVHLQPSARDPGKGGA